MSTTQDSVERDGVREARAIEVLTMLANSPDVALTVAKFGPGYIAEAARLALAALRTEPDDKGAT